MTVLLAGDRKTRRDFVIMANPTVPENEITSSPCKKYQNFRDTIFNAIA
jgi:hypothetical protein